MGEKGTIPDERTGAKEVGDSELGATVDEPTREVGDAALRLSTGIGGEET